MTNRLVAAVMLTSLATGCAWWQERSRTTKGAVYGTGAGAATGAAIGGVLGGSSGAAKGAAVGAAVGALGGAGVGYYMDRQAKEMEQVVARQDRVEREGDTLRVALSSDVLFDSGSARLQPGARDKLDQVARVLERYPRTRVEVVGHTDARGGESANETLSERRAEAVRDVLVRDGVAAERVTARGEGERRPVATNETHEGRALNRRVEIVSRAEQAAGSEARGVERGAPPPASRTEPEYEPH